MAFWNLCPIICVRVRTRTVAGWPVTASSSNAPASEAQGKCVTRGTRSAIEGIVF